MRDHVGRPGFDRNVFFFCLIGLPLLISSAYFLPPLAPNGAYLLPSGDVFSLVIVPSFIGIFASSILIAAGSMVARRFMSPIIRSAVMIAGIAFLTLIALKSTLYALGYDWQSSFRHDGVLIVSVRNRRFGTGLILIALVWATRRAIPTWIRMLGSLGLAFGMLAAARLAVFLLAMHSPATLSQLAVANPARSVSAHSSGVAIPPPAVAKTNERRVIWVIFDEADFNLMYGESSHQPDLPNFDRLAREGVFATNANSPASATLYSIPALLTGMPLVNPGIRISNDSRLSVAHDDGSMLAFDETTTIFGALAASNRNTSILGFYQPYCRLFTHSKCASSAYPEVGGWDAVLRANIPDSIAARLSKFNHWDSITDTTLRLLSHYLAGEEALTFIHLNVPHPPADYADKVLSLPVSADPITEYQHNLLFADHVLGQILEQVQKQASSFDLLLVVSSDHWLRNRWYRPGRDEVSGPVPLIMWKANEKDGLVLSQPVSTVHTAAFVLDYLDGHLESQNDFYTWWQRQPVYPTFIAPND